MDCVIHPTYFPNVAHFVAMLKADTVHLEVCDNYQKQTLRNRTEVLSPQGKLGLTVPVIYSQKNRQLYKDVRISNDSKWQQLHLKTLETSYNASPFFEFYIDDILPLFQKHYNFILDFNIECLDILLSVLHVDISITNTTGYDKIPANKMDHRPLVKPNLNIDTFSKYTQVFFKKYDFVQNLSVLDLIFNEGPNSEIYLLKQDLQHV